MTRKEAEADRAVIRRIRLEMALEKVHTAEAALAEAELAYEAASRDECNLHCRNLRAGADELDEQVRHEVEITRLRAPYDAAHASVANAIDKYWRIYNSKE